MTLGVSFNQLFAFSNFKVSRSFVYSVYVQVVKLNDVASNQNGTIVGWGSPYQGGYLSVRPLSSDIPIITDTDTCNNHTYFDSDVEICAGDRKTYVTMYGERSLNAVIVS